MKFRFIGENASGCVVFRSANAAITMPTGEAVGVPDWLAKKLVNNREFEAVPDELPVIEAVETQFVETPIEHFVTDPAQERKPRRGRKAAA